MDEICNISVRSLGYGDYEILCNPDSTFCDAVVWQNSEPKNFNNDSASHLTNGFVKISSSGEDNHRQYFLLESTAGKSLVCAQRNVPLEGSVNFRDLGGYLTETGKRVTWGKIFRSGHLSGLTLFGATAYAGLGINTVCDFRLLEEKASENAELPGDPVICTLEIMPGVGSPHYFHDLFESKPSEGAVVTAMHQMMRCLVTDNISAYGRLFESLLGAEEGAVLLNCSAGKERTGFGAALILECLGVSRETVVYDFMLSKKYFPAEQEIERVLQKYSVSNQNGEGVKIIMPLLETRESYLKAAFDCIDEKYGSTRSFVKKCFGLTNNDLKQLINKFTV